MWKPEQSTDHETSRHLPLCGLLYRPLLVCVTPRMEIIEAIDTPLCRLVSAGFLFLSCSNIGGPSASSGLQTKDQRVDAWDCGTELILPGVQRAQRTSSVQAQAPFPQGELSKNSFLSSLSCASPFATLHGSVYHPFLFGTTS